MTTSRDRTTIYALSSAPGRAGVAIIRLSGPAAAHCLDVLTANRRPPPRAAALRALHHPASGDKLDTGLVLWMPGPKSFTGEDCAELHVHGGHAVTRALLEALATVPGCRLAEPGEFARRAFDNGKLDLTEAEGLADLIDAETEAQRKQALAQASGALSQLYEDWRATLIEAQALAEAAIDFADEGDVGGQAMARAAELVASLEAEIKSHLDDGHRGEILRTGFQVVLAGPPNAGKSSLLNALARRDAAIVTPEAGTTRDVLEVHLDLKGYPVIVCDTAGLRHTSEAIEGEGIRRARARAETADLVLWLGDEPDTGSWPPHGLNVPADKILPVLTKRDVLAPAPLPPDLLAVSSKTGEGLGQLINRIAAEAESRLATGDNPTPALTQARHRQAVSTALEALEAFQLGSLEDSELRAEDLRRAAFQLGRVTGRVDVEDVLDQVFARFCIGK